ncbi:MAG TPA: hypothetical protein VMT79_19285 [Candidatus Binatia bacterium]|nr:hypothetical protein [Candidatus Binatia bacterium]
MYPQVTIRASVLATGRVITGRPAEPAGRAFERLRAAAVTAVLLGRGRVARGADLEQAARWGLTRLAAGDVAWDGVPAVAGSAPESQVRRLLASGAPMVLLTESGQVTALVEPAHVPVPPVEGSMARVLDAADPVADARLWVLRTAGKTAESLGSAVYLVGGGVRDLLLGRASPDLDLAVEGDGIAFAARLAEEVGGRLVSHPTFGTASIEGGRAAGGAALGRIDVASARRERYDAPGQLPRVEVAGIAEDLRRRDFSVNAMAVALAPARFGRLLDPFGGQGDLRRRQLRPLGPLSFVEDPTRIFRAARYGARLGFRLSGAGRRALGLALRVSALGRGFPALSGPRLAAELRLIAGEVSGWTALERLAGWGALRVWDRAFGRAARVRSRLRAARRLEVWGERAGVALDRYDLARLALLLDQAPAVQRRCLTRLGMSGAPRAEIAAALAAARPTARGLAGSRLRTSTAAARMRRLSSPGLIAAWLVGGRRARLRVQWFLAEGRAVRPALRGEDLLTLGVVPGPAMAAVIAALRDGRLDGRLRSAADERAFVREQRAGEKGGST